MSTSIINNMLNNADFVFPAALTTLTIDASSVVEVPSVTPVNVITRVI